jgi:hypothetical protein
MQSRRTFLILTSLVILTATAYAATEYKFDTGKCENGNTWWSVSSYSDGELYQVTGLDCDGRNYRRYLTAIHHVPTDPTGGETPTFTGPGWYALVRYDAFHRVIWEGGKASDNSFWEAGFTYDDDNNPTPGNIY